MRVKQYKSLFQLTFLPNLFPVNCYIVEEEQELTLIDAALPYSHKGILETAKSIGKPITKIILTHAHDDHVGALDQLKNEIPQASVYISARDAKLMDGNKSLEPHEPQTPIKGGVPKTLKTRANVLLYEGDKIGSLRAISSPGHTPGSMSFIHEGTQALIAGDAFQTRAGTAVAGVKNLLFPFPAFGTWNKEVALESSKKLLALTPSLLAVGHGKVLLNPLQSINEAILKAEKELESA